ASIPATPLPLASAPRPIAAALPLPSSLRAAAAPPTPPRRRPATTFPNAPTTYPPAPYLPPFRPAPSSPQIAPPASPPAPRAKPPQPAPNPELKSEYTRPASTNPLPLSATFRFIRCIHRRRQNRRIRSCSAPPRFRLCLR